MDGDWCMVGKDLLMMMILLKHYISSLHLDHLIDLFEREQITLEILVEMGHDDLKQVGVSAYGFRHKILKGIAQLRSTAGELIELMHGQ